MMKSEVSTRLLLHAPNVHAGGGLILLNDLLININFADLWLQIDGRAKEYLSKSENAQMFFVRRSIASRLFAELRLWVSCRPDDIVLCFSGLPPLFPVRGRVVVFIQNRLLIEDGGLSEYPLSVQARLWIERMWGFSLRGRCFRYIVQSPTMATLLRQWLRRDTPISMTPFAALTVKLESGSSKKLYDFVYVASGDAHKNHVMLLEAWRLLAAEAFKPTLALTVDPARFPAIHTEILKAVNEYSLSIVNLGQLSSDEVADLYRSSSALIYPSKTESFGLPLIEATQYKLPILASELDYVRDVVVPVETFDPNSPVSIARAVRRFLGNAEPTVHIHSAEEFLAEVLR